MTAIRLAIRLTNPEPSDWQMPPGVVCLPTGSRLGSCRPCPRRHIVECRRTDAQRCHSLNFAREIHSAERVRVCTADEFCDRLLSLQGTLKTHHYVSKWQAQYLCDLKTHFKRDEAIVVMDFSENYAFLVKDAIQSYHWVNTQCTLHPFVVYFRPDDNILHMSIKSFVAISDCLEHVTAAVSAFQAELLGLLAKDLPSVRKIYYFSDGASSQYKKNFLNLCYHESDFHLSAEWNFFATSHGKSACDGVGGTVKRLASRASIQRPYEDQMMTPHELFLWAERNITGITVFWVPDNAVQDRKAKLAGRFEKALSIKGTRSFHHFEPSSLSNLQAGLTSTKQKFLSLLKQKLFRLNFVK